MQAVSAKVLLNDEVCRSSGRKLCEPELENLMEDGLADADRRVRPYAIYHEAIGKLVRSRYSHVGEPESRGVCTAKIAGSTIHIDGPNRCLWIAASECARDGSVPAANVDQCLIAGCWLRSVEQQKLGAAIDSIRGKDPSVGCQLDAAIGEHKIDLTSVRTGRRLGLEIL